MPRNPSELQRLEEERTELINQITSGKYNPSNPNSAYAPKSVKEGWLQELRAIERQLGIKGLPYNGAFGGR